MANQHILLSILHPTCQAGCACCEYAGDLLTALLLAWLHKLPGDMASAVEHALAGVQNILQATADACGEYATVQERSSQVF